MNIAPKTPTDQAVLALVQHEWLSTADRVAYLPVGFGAHHWRIDADGVPCLFATLDHPSERRTLENLEHAYAAADGLVQDGFAGAIAPIRAASISYTVPLADGVMSVTPWLEGRNPTLVESRQTAHVKKVIELLTDLHACEPTTAMPEWRPRVPADCTDELRERVQRPWEKGPLGEEARQKIVNGMDVVADSLREYYMLAQIALATRDRWVPTHGEPHWANQFLTNDRLVLVDWDTVALGPPEIDMVDLPWSARTELGADEDMLKMFRLEWQLQEVAEYADWFEGEHVGSEDDHFALAKLDEELRPI